MVIGVLTEPAETCFHVLLERSLRAVIKCVYWRQTPTSQECCPRNLIAVVAIKSIRTLSQVYDSTDIDSWEPSPRFGGMQ